MALPTDMEVIDWMRSTCAEQCGRRMLSDDGGYWSYLRDRVDVLLRELSSAIRQNKEGARGYES